MEHTGNIRPQKGEHTSPSASIHLEEASAVSSNLPVLGCYALGGGSEWYIIVIGTHQNKLYKWVQKYRRF